MVCAATDKPLLLMTLLRHLRPARTIVFAGSLQAADRYGVLFDQDAHPVNQALAGHLFACLVQAVRLPPGNGRERCSAFEPQGRRNIGPASFQG